jgi:hypothetical protein
MPKDALPHLLAAVKLNPTNEMSHFLLARVYKTLGDSSQSDAEMRLFQKYHELSDPHPEYRKAVPAVAPPEVTKQALDTAPKPEP